jgi:aminopeptidase N
MGALRTLLAAVAALCVLLLATSPTSAQTRDPYDSGGLLSPDQAAYDASYYALDVRVEPSDSSITGSLVMTARLESPTQAIGLDLDPLLDVYAVDLKSGAAFESAQWTRDGGRITVPLPESLQPGQIFAVRVEYGGMPRVAPRPPWDGGFTWARTGDGSPWIATSNQMIGADVWWPVKDHVSDKPDSMSIRVTVPEPLFVATNGRLRGVSDPEPGYATYDWFVSTPISTYNVALNIAPYAQLDTTLTSLSGETFPISFWVLPEDEERGRVLFDEIVDQVRWFEIEIGPYPFRADKYGVAQTPHLGMEHQSIIAYGANFSNGAMTGGVDWGFDALHHHELSHEWWGNMVTNADWKDMWIHEGFGTYMQALYVEDRQGIDRYHDYMNSFSHRIGNRKPVAPRETTSAQEIYDGHDIYFKGAWVLHTLRYLIGEDALMLALRRMAYPTPEAWRATDGSQVRFADTDEFVAIAEEVSGRELDWFFDVYVHEADLPTLELTREEGELRMAWDVPGDRPFPMPVEVQIDGDIRRVEMAGGRAVVKVPAGAEVSADPDDWILRSRGSD